MRFGLFLFQIALSVALPLATRDDNPSLTPVTPKDSIISTQDLFDKISTSLWTQFWSNDTMKWKSTCDGAGEPHLWDVSVASMAIVNTKNMAKIDHTFDVLAKYRNSKLGGYSATTAADTDIYTDDDAQAAWVFIDGSDVSQKGERIIDYIETQKDNKTGGILWNYGKPYIALISNVEAALAAMKSYDLRKSSDMLEFAKHCLNYTFSNLVDSSDHFIYDGIDENGNLNKGKLTYTIGVAISTMAYLSKYDQTQDWKSKALTLALRTINYGKLDTQFFSNSYINDSLDHSHNLFIGFVDLLQLTSPSGDYESSAYDLIKKETIREARNLYDKHDASISLCTSDLNSLLDFGSLTQIFYQVSRISDRI